jgi:hypothetical protein
MLPNITFQSSLGKIPIVPFFSFDSSDVIETSFSA